METEITSTSNDELKQLYMNDLTHRIVEVIENFPNKSSISSVILTGSLGRDEATFSYLSKGNTQNKEAILVSDVELALVYKLGCKKHAKILKEILINNFKAEDMNPMTISLSRVKNMYNFNYMLVKPKYSSIFMYDLYNGSTTIWGEDLITSKKENHLAKYDKYEAKRIVANRIGELSYLTYVDKAKDKQIKQWEGKLMLALGTAYCIINDNYKSPYKKQLEFIQSNQEKENINQLFGEHFIDDYKEAYNHLRLGVNSYNVPLERIKYYVERIDDLVFSINTDCREPKINSFSRRLKYTVSAVKAGVSIMKVEKEIIDRLIKHFTKNQEAELKSTSIHWKRILY